MALSRFIEIAGNGPSSCRWIVDLGAGKGILVDRIGIAAPSSGDQDFAILKQGSSVKKTRGIQVAAEAPCSCRRVVQLCAVEIGSGTVNTTRNQDRTIGQQRCSMP